MIGLLMVQLAKLAGAARVALLEPVESKREVGRQLGADVCIDSLHEDVGARLREAGITWVNTVIDMCGTSFDDRAGDRPGRKQSGGYDVRADKAG